MATYTYEIMGFFWRGVGIANHLLPIVITDDDEYMSSAEEPDYTEVITLEGKSFTDPIGGTYALFFINSKGEEVIEPFLLLGVDADVYVVAPLKKTQFENGMEFTGVGGWQNVLGDRWDNIVCFCAGSLIQTINGARKVESIQIGDVIKTKAGFSEVRWVGKRTLELKDLRENPKLFPVRIEAGALGAGLPKRDLLVSRQHRMMIFSKIARRMFGNDVALISAIKLTKLPGIYVDENVGSVEYFHLLFDKHEIIYAEEAPSESLFLGPGAFRAMSPEDMEEILTIFPEVAESNLIKSSVCPIPLGRLQKKLVSRHLKNNKPILS